MTNTTYRSYAEFWPDYLRAHSKPATRMVHYIGTALSIAFIVMFFVTLDSSYLLPALVTPYAFAWASHMFIQGNQPVSFKHPIWSVISGVRMFGLWLAGALQPELAKAGLPADTTV